MNYLEVLHNCWSAGFTYAAYIDYVKELVNSGHTNPHTVSEAAYKLICTGLELDMEEQNEPMDTDSNDESPCTMCDGSCLK